ncbi:TPA: hypothetical protein ACXN37_000165 [Stenotrophomonas maltophilia]|uniref:hypothetical protein n=1 Tax=Stenotrophomonas maltophilia TaxID=40324 RepID=UPI0013DD2D13|nr:hypothetical protein [Stenotrophomonas maltophilia]MBN5162387.1 hypothetical protein [Stenotrophomonas maltophilia]
MNVIGTCSLCGGAVCTPELWGGVLPPQPTCNRCGAVAANHGPIIPMRRVEKQSGPYTAKGPSPEINYAPHEILESWWEP